LRMVSKASFATPASLSCVRSTASSSASFKAWSSGLSSTSSSPTTPGSLDASGFSPSFFYPPFDGTFSATAFFVVTLSSLPLAILFGDGGRGDKTFSFVRSSNNKIKQNKNKRTGMYVCMYVCVGLHV
jgi:hypothetical protein